MFPNRHEWFAHEMKVHRREWTCQHCNHRPFNSAPAFQSHVSNKHPKLLSTSQIEALLLKCNEPIDRILPDACHLCDDWEKSLLDSDPKLPRDSHSILGPESRSGTIGRFRRHLGRHLEQLALFSLPSYWGEEELDDASSDRDADSQESHDKIRAARNTVQSDRKSEINRVSMSKSSHFSVSPGSAIPISRGSSADEL